jgi:hypothetical protein
VCLEPLWQEGLLLRSKYHRLVHFRQSNCKVFGWKRSWISRGVTIQGFAWTDWRNARGTSLNRLCPGPDSKLTPPEYQLSVLLPTWNCLARLYVTVCRTDIFPSTRSPRFTKITPENKFMNCFIHGWKFTVPGKYVTNFLQKTHKIVRQILYSTA